MTHFVVRTIMAIALTSLAGCYLFAPTEPPGGAYKKALKGATGGDSSKMAPAPRRALQTPPRKEELAQEFLRYRQQRSSDEQSQSDRKSGTSPAEPPPEQWEALLQEFLRWQEQHYPKQPAQATEETFEEVLGTLYKR